MMFDQQESVLKLSVSATCDSGEPSIKSNNIIQTMHTNFLDTWHS